MDIEKQIKEWADEAVRKRSNIEDQKEYVWLRAKNQPDLVEELARRGVKEICDTVLYSSRHEQKSKIIADCFKDRKYANESPRTKKIMQECIMDTFFCGEKPIGDCTFAEVLQQADWHTRNSNGHLLRANIFKKIGKLGKPTQIVRKIIKAKKIARIIGNAKSNSKSLEEQIK